jgi:hypothetical protein
MALKVESGLSLAEDAEGERSTIVVLMRVARTTSW